MEEQNINPKIKMERLKIQFAILQDIINRKSEILSIVSMLAAAFLVIVMFNNKSEDNKSEVGLPALLFFRNSK